MTSRRTAALLCTVLVALASAVAPAAAEWNIDLYGGAAWVESADLKVTGTGTNGAAANLTIFDLDSNTGFTFGLRTGYWFDSLPFLGLDLDVFYMQVPVPAQTTTGTGALTGHILGKPITVGINGVASIPEATLPMFAFAPEISLRWPLMVDASFPRGRLQPYVNLGPAFAFSLKNDNIAIQIGGKLGGGLAFQLTPWLALFSEYRYAFFPGFTFTDEHLKYKANVNTHTVAGGISFRF